MRLTNYTLATLAATLLASGCAEREPRSFVQPNVIKKSDLEGTWYYIQTVSDAPPTSNSAFIGLSSDLMKIRFDVQEGTLFARRAYEQISGSEDKFQQDPAKYAGMPMAAWNISNQFDIIRDYNATTGEETNRIIESTERPWSEREFIRVDWSKNQATDYVGIGLNFFFDGVKVQGVSYWESDPASPDALHMERADEKDAEWVDPNDPNKTHLGEAKYLDLTNKMVLDPDSRTECYDGECFTFPACFFYYSTSDCSSQVVKVKHAFSKIPPRHDYQPRNWDGKQMDLFGIWDVGLNRLTYNRQYGVTNSGFKRHAARFNLWKKSYQDDGKTLIPYEQRELRTTPYYAESSNGTFPPELFETGRNVIDQWNDAVSTAVKDVTNGVLPAAGTRVFVWCHNPVKLAADENGAKDDDACAADLRPELDAKGNIIKDKNDNPILKARQGDPRRSTIFWVNQEQDAGPLGYGPPLFDIETGETISGQAYIYGAAVDTYSARSRDLVLLITGKITDDEFVKGVNVKEWVSQNRAGVMNQPQMKTMNEQDVLDRVKAMDFSWAKGAAPEAPIDFSGPAAFYSSLKNRDQAMYKQGVFGSAQANVGQVLRDSLRGTDIEAKMITSDIMAMGGNSPKNDWTALSEAEKARISPLRSKTVTRAINDRLDRMRALGIDFSDFADEGIAQRAINLANDPAVPNMDPEAIRQKLRKDIFLGVTLHEVGHNMGLRHNFRASFDAMNYFPKYWELREGAAKNPAAKRYMGMDSTGKPIAGTFGGADCNDANRKGTMRPRYIDCPGGATSVDEVIGGVREYQYSSIMDYGNEFNSDLMGLGHYDKAAMKFSYAGDGYVEVFTDVQIGSDEQLSRFASVQTFSGAFGFPSPLNLFGANFSSVNYETFPKMFLSGSAGFEKRADVPYADVPELAPWESRGSINDFVRQDLEGRPMVPYFFCSDEFVGNLTCQRFDSGADAYEQSQDLISRYHNFYLMNNFKRDRYTFHSSSGYGARIAGRYFDMLREQMTWYTLLRADYTESVGPAEIGQFFSAEDGWGNFSLAVANNFDMFGRVLTTPDAGTFRKVTAAESPDFPYEYWKQNSDDVSNMNGQKGVLPLQGKYAATTWDFDTCGYYWADQCQTRIGYLLDKVAALDILSQSQAYFTGRDTSTDVRRYAIGFIRPFKHQIEEKLGAILAGDYTSLAPQLVTDAMLNTTVKYDSWSLNNAATAVPKTDIVDPTTGFTMQLYAAIYGLSEFPGTYDQDFVDTTRIFVVGNGEAPVPDTQVLAEGSFTGTDLVTTGGAKKWMLWTDPSSAKTYAAQARVKVGDGDTVGVYRNDTGARMLQQAVALQNAVTAACVAPTSSSCLAKKTAATNFRDNLDLMRGLHKRFGYARP